MLARTPDPLDVMVGARIRIFRTHRGMSQSDLAGKIGVAFQQVQKYEKGINRVGASRLSRIAAVLGISISELFDSSGSKPADLKSPFRLLAERDALRVLTAFSRTTDSRVRRAIAVWSKLSPTCSLPRNLQPGVLWPQSAVNSLASRFFR
jgi:transcriptional regulator with XRE-family HTH domain